MVLFYKNLFFISTIRPVQNEKSSRDVAFSAGKPPGRAKGKKGDAAPLSRDARRASRCPPIGIQEKKLNSLTYYL
jgi:hypothetical protein